MESSSSRRKSKKNTTTDPENSSLQVNFSGIGFILALALVAGILLSYRIWNSNAKHISAWLKSYNVMENFSGINADAKQFSSEPLENIDSQPAPALDQPVCFSSPRKENLCVLKDICYIENKWTIYNDVDGAICTISTPKVDYKLRNRCKQLIKQTFLAGGFFPEECPNFETYPQHLQEVKSKYTWVQRETALILLPSTGGTNIAHYAGFVFHYYHAVSNKHMYNISSQPQLILRVPDQLEEKMEDPSSWHYGVLQALFPAIAYSAIKPSLNNTAKVGQYLKRKSPFLVAYVREFSDMFPSETSRGICFERLVVSSLLKGRYFVDNSELLDPSGVPVKSTRFAKDALQLRNSMQKQFGLVELQLNVKRMIYLKRVKRRAFDDASETLMINLLSSMANKHGMEFSRVTFDGRQPFMDQVKAVWDAYFAVGVHGANLVNTIFMPMSATLIEIFPFGFSHIMYYRGCGTGIRYYKFTLKTGGEFYRLRAYKNREECISKNLECKNFYRSDRRPLTITVDECLALGQLIDQAVDAERSQSSQAKTYESMETPNNESTETKSMETKNHQLTKSQP